MTILRRQRGRYTVGKELHRSGWPACIAEIAPLMSDDGPIRLDDFIEQSFLYSGAPGDQRSLWHARPWVGFLHHPPDMPRWYMAGMRLEHMATLASWESALPQLKLVFVLAQNQYDWWKETYPDIPVELIRHPTGRPAMYWDPERFLRNPYRRLIQVGWFLRNTASIYHVDVPPGLHKVHLFPSRRNIRHFHALCLEAAAKFWPERRVKGQVEQWRYLDHFSYDLVLSENVVFLDLLGAAANNAVVECIMRNTPVCVNRNPGTLTYLPDDYPLYYENLWEVRELLTVENIIRAHEYLRDMEKRWIYLPVFRRTLSALLARHFPEHADRIPMEQGEELRDLVQC